MTVQQFEGASAIVSGGAGGLGEATVRRLHADGLGVVIADLADDKGKALADELGSRALFVSTDVTSEDSILAAIEQANQLGQLRYAVVAHGGFGVAQRIVQRDGSPADFGGFTKTIDLYLNGTYNMARLVAAAVATAEPRDSGERGALVLTASIAGYEGQIGQTAYAAAKAGVIGLDHRRGARPEFGGHPGQHHRTGDHEDADHGVCRRRSHRQVRRQRAVPEAAGYARRIRRRRDVPAHQRLRQRRGDAPRRCAAVHPEVGATGATADPPAEARGAPTSASSSP